MNVLIIGGFSDIGLSFSKYYRDMGYNVIVGYHNNYIDIDGIDKYKCDVKDINSIEEIIKYVINKYGNIDILINMFAICRDNSFLDKTKEEFMDVLETNLVGTFLCCQIYSKYVSNGLIINMGSTDGIDTFSEYSIDYSASKAGIINISKNMSNYINNRILCICPNWIDSDSTRSMDKEYLDNELKKIKQDRLITISELIDSVNKIINKDNCSGVYRIDVKDNNLIIMKV